MLGVQRFLLLFAAGQIDIHGRAGSKTLRAEERLQCRADFCHEVLLYLLTHLERFARRLRAIARSRSLGPAQKRAIHVHQRDGFGSQSFDGAGHQVGNGEHVLGGERRARP